MMNWDYMMNGWTGGWMWIPLALLVALLALGLVAAIDAKWTQAGPSTDGVPR